jgi:GNAT superfamily N-acetyltransferase
MLTYFRSKMKGGLNMINIRLARTEEIKTLNELVTLSATELSKEDYSEQEIKAAIQYIFGVDTDLVNDKTYFVIEKNGEIAGCGGWSRRKKLFGGNQFSGTSEPAFLDPLHDAAKIRAFFIHPKFSRQGLGSILLQHCENEAQKKGFAKLEMMATLPGVKLYKQLGYQSVSHEVVVLPNKVPLRLVHMRKNIKSYILSSKYNLFINEKKNSDIYIKSDVSLKAKL